MQIKTFNAALYLLNLSICLYYVFKEYLINGTIFRNNAMNYNILVLIHLYKFCLKMFYLQIHSAMYYHTSTGVYV